MKKTIIVIITALVCWNIAQSQEKMKIAVINTYPHANFFKHFPDFNFNEVSRMLLSALSESEKFDIIDSVQTKQAFEEAFKEVRSQNPNAIAIKPIPVVLKVGEMLSVKKMIIGIVHSDISHRNLILIVQVVDMAMGICEWNIERAVPAEEIFKLKDIIPEFVRELTQKIVEGQQVIKIDSLYVFPVDVDIYATDYEMAEKIEKINLNNSYGYNNWRMPTVKEMQLIYDNRAIVGLDDFSTYLSSEKEGNLVKVMRSEDGSWWLSYPEELTYSRANRTFRLVRTE